MKSKSSIFILILLTLAAVAGCRSRTDRTEGTVILSISDFDGLPVTASVTNGPFQIGQITLRSTAKEPGGVTSPLQDTEIRSYEVRFTRLDTGSRQVPTLVGAIFGILPVGGTTQFDNLPFLRPDQLANPPFSDLTKFGADQQTGSRVIPVRVSLRFFGRTLSGDDVATETASFNVDVVP